MKVFLGMLLVLLLLLVLLPIGMMEMAECPMCISPDTHLALGICAAVISLLGLKVPLMSSRLRTMEELARAFWISRSIYRPPRVA